MCKEDSFYYFHYSALSRPLWAFVIRLYIKINLPYFEKQYLLGYFKAFFTS